MEQVHPNVAGLFGPAIDAQLQSNIAWARMARANEAMGGPWLITMHCLGLGLSKCSCWFFSAHLSAQGRGLEGVFTPARTIRPGRFQEMLELVVQDRAELERRYSERMTKAPPHAVQQAN